MTKPIVLIILDGWGHSHQISHNPIKIAATPNVDFLLNHYPNTLLQASGIAVGLPEGQMGNSEVGHLHIGAGRKIPQDLTRINQAIKDDDFNQNSVFLAAINHAKQHHCAIHSIGLLSPGGVHSHIAQINEMIKLIGSHGIEKNYFHAILDGRDTPPQSALNSIISIEQLYKQLPGGKIASLIGRYFAMDRDQRWDRTKIAYDLLTQGIGDYYIDNPENALHAAYARNETDEFISATIIADQPQQAITIKDGDVVIFMNFRADRTRQLCHALYDKNFIGFERTIFPQLHSLITLTDYGEHLNAIAAFPPLIIQNCLGEYIANNGLKQLRIAETEKYAHVTYFLNGGLENQYQGEQRILIPSPKVRTYDLMPQMSALELTDRLVEAIESQDYDVIICNYANPDMIGHTGIEKAAIQAVEVIDSCLGRIISSLQKVDGEALITADHGNIEQMYDEKHNQPHTAHTNNLVPLIYFGHRAKFIPQERQQALDDIAPTLLYLIGLPPPIEMTGHNLLKLTEQ